MQILVDARAAVALLARVERRAHQHLQLAIALRVRRFRARAPGVEPARRHAQSTDTASATGKLAFSAAIQREPYRWCFAKKAAAFFRMSRSVRSSRFSLRSRASSSRSAVVSPVLPVRPIGPGPLDPLAQRRLGQIEIAGDGADRLALVEDQADGAGFELVSELPARRRRLRRVGHVGTSYPPFGRCPRNRIKPRTPACRADLAACGLRLAQIVREFADCGGPTPAASTT